MGSTLTYNRDQGEQIEESKERRKSIEDGRPKTQMKENDQRPKYSYYESLAKPLRDQNRLSLSQRFSGSSSEKNSYAQSPHRTDNSLIGAPMSATTNNASLVPESHLPIQPRTASNAIQKSNRSVPLKSGPRRPTCQNVLESPQRKLKLMSKLK